MSTNAGTSFDLPYDTPVTQPTVSSQTFVAIYYG